MSLVDICHTSANATHQKTIRISNFASHILQIQRKALKKIVPTNLSCSRFASCCIYIESRELRGQIKYLCLVYPCKPVVFASFSELSELGKMQMTLASTQLASSIRNMQDWAEYFTVRTHPKRKNSFLIFLVEERRDKHKEYEILKSFEYMYENEHRQILAAFLRY